MSKLKGYGRAFMVLGFLTMGGLPMASAQNVPAAPRDPMADLLVEVRGLRAEMRAALDASFRAQLLVARLQLQEQRITVLSRQLTDVQRQIGENERGRTPLATQVAMMGGDDATSLKEREEREQAIRPLKNILDQLEKADRDLKSQETHLTGLIAEEQARWADFNARLDQLAMQIETRVK